MAVEEHTGGLKCSLTAYVRDEKCSPVVVGRPRGATAARLHIHTYILSHNKHTHIHTKAHDEQRITAELFSSQRISHPQQRPWVAELGPLRTAPL